MFFQKYSNFAGDIIALTGKPVNDPKVANPVICNQGNRKLMENENINKADKDVLNRMAQCLQKLKHKKSSANNIVIIPNCNIVKSKKPKKDTPASIEKSNFCVRHANSMRKKSRIPAKTTVSRTMDCLMDGNQTCFNDLAQFLANIMAAGIKLWAIPLLKISVSSTPPK
ncbi:hypothetical protein CRE_30166 [Caenorhabditis remanei]|uniref:Uncharacterized protein n=1 Tax=Caenorhabditis remanei TaxID=31234 RepID=E3NE19_CAERE|nr:hypothetical protein CRE_30166 [Caenorhabditis remanei]